MQAREHILAATDFPSRCRRAVGRGGFTFVELCLALVVSTMMLSAVAGFSLAMASHWKSSDGTQSGSLSASQAVARIQKRLFTAKRLGFCRAGGPDARKPAAIVYWRADDNGDGVMEFSELAVLMFNNVDHTIDVYQPVLIGGATDDVWTSAAFNASSAIATLTTNQTPTTLAARIAQVTFGTTNATSATVLPTFTFAMEVAQPDGTTAHEFGAATLRAAATPAP